MSAVTERPGSPEHAAPAASGTRSARIAATARRIVADRRSTRVRHGAIVAAIGAVVLGAVVVALHLTGDAEIPVADVIPAALGARDGLAGYVVHETQLPRALVAVLGGALFGLSGAVSQRLIGNPLATPDIIGISSGAGAGALLVIAGFSARGLGVQAGALAGALIVAALIYLLSWRGGVQTYRLVLVGIGIGACATAAITLLVTRLDEITSQRAQQWLIGSLNGSDWNDVTVLGITVVVGGAITVAIRRSLGDLALGDELAIGLGTRVRPTRFAALLLVAALAAVVTSVTGPIAFIALVAGPIAVRLLRVPDAPLTAALVGAVLLTVSDIAAQAAPIISPVPTGAITAVLGAPALIALLMQRRTSV